MNQDKITLAVWILDLAFKYGPALFDAVKRALDGEMSPEENAETLRRWEDNEDRARRNAGLPPVA